MLDLALASAHHLIVFTLFAILAIELVLVRRGMTVEHVARVSRIDLGYGVLAAAIVVVGFVRAIFAAKGWAYYSHNGFFWAKIATFTAVGLLSIPPTLSIIRWRRGGEALSDAEARRVRGLLHVEATLFILLPIFAAAMARGYGQFG